ncbi:MAG TPA: hypothetical protein VIO60_05635 [Rectinemataceae bacterium]
MDHRAATIADRIQNAIEGWAGVEALTLDPRAEISPFDPYFALVFDVYYRGSIPSPGARRQAFGDPGAYETGAGGTKDRFFLDELPIRVEYKEIEALDRLLDKPLLHIRLLKNAGTYSFYRLSTNAVLKDRSGWIGEAKAKLAAFPQAAWEALGDTFRSKMEHYLSDMGAASFSGDKYFLLLSEAGFLRYAAASIFMANRSFEPSHRDMEEKLRLLPRQPDGFWQAWDSLLQKGKEISAPRRFEIARMLASSIYSLGSD